MKILVIDIGGTNVKLMASDQKEVRRFASGPKLTAGQMVAKVKQRTAGWKYEAVSLGFPGTVRNGMPASEPKNLGPGWVDFDYEAALGRKVRIINDAALQALGSYKVGRMLFIGLGTSVGSTLIVDNVVIPLELGLLKYNGRTTFEEALGDDGLATLGQEKWERAIHEITDMLRTTFVVDDMVIGGGSAKLIKTLPPGSRRGDNRNAFQGGLRLWQKKPAPVEVRESTWRLD